MNFAEFFGHNLDAVPEEYGEPFEVWCWRWVHEERVALESVRESLRPAAKAAAPETPALPDGVPINSSIAEAWRLYHSVPHRTRESTQEPVRENGRDVRPRRRPMHTLVADPDARHLLP